MVILQKREAGALVISGARLIAISGIGWMFDAMDVILLSYILLVSARELGLGTPEKAAVILANNVGMLVGAALFGRLSDRAGRRRVFITTLALYSVATGATALVSNPAELAIARFVTGLGLGGELPVVSAYVSELSPPERRGRNVVLLESFWSVGSLAAAAVAYLLFPRLGWRVTLLVLSATALYAAVVRATLPEHLPPREERVELPAFVRMLLPVWYIWFALALGYYGVVMWLPTILVAEKGFAVVRTLEFMLVTTAAQIPGYLTAAWLVERLGRRAAATAFFLASAASVLGLAHGADETQLLASALAFNFFNLGAWGVVYAYTPELFPGRVRGLACGTAGSMARVGMIAGPVLYPTVGLVYGLATISALWLLVCAAVLALPETKAAGMRRLGAPPGG
jgi:putative MFS transporter